jgi:hypothetical protein
MVLQVDKSIIGWDSTIGSWSRLENHCVLGEDVQVKVSACAGELLLCNTCFTPSQCLFQPLSPAWCRLDLSVAEEVHTAVVLYAFNRHPLWRLALHCLCLLLLRLCLQDELYLNGAVVLPHKEIKEAVPSPNIIL